jgi:hypothetical protein
MKIVVDRMPIEPAQCLFVDERVAYTNNKTTFTLYKCGVDKKDCELVCNAHCSKLKVLKE